MLRDLQLYLRDRQRASLTDLAQQFRSDPDALRAMLDRLIRKGRVCKESATVCGGCHACNPETLEFYEWVAE